MTSAIEIAAEPAVPLGPDWIFNRPTEPKDKQGVFDFRLLNRQFLDNLSLVGEPQSPLPLRTLLPADYAWGTPDGKQRIPVALSEFAAYKAALAYEDEGVIAQNLGNARNFAFFDSNRKSAADAGKLDNIADTQGFGFTYDGMVFVVLRGTEIKKKADRLVDVEDTLTDTALAPLLLCRR